MNTDPAVSHIKLYGERNTGSNYLQALLAGNLAVELLPGTVPASFQRTCGEDEAAKDRYFDDTFSHNLGWKHAMAPGPGRLANLGVYARKILFITLTKNPYSWLLSLYRQPYHVQQTYRSFSEFLATPWETVGRELAGPVFASPIDMWNRKNASYLELASYANCVNLRYEDLLRDEEGTVQSIAHDYALAKRTSRFLSLERSTNNEHAKNNAYYRDYYLAEKWREELDARQIEQINSGIDRDVLESFGYQLIG